jgi:hypothetical protein
MSISSINSNHSNNQNVANPYFDRKETIENILNIALVLEDPLTASNLDEEDKKLLNELLAIKADLQDGKYVSDQRLQDCMVSFYMSEPCPCDA